MGLRSFWVETKMVLFSRSFFFFPFSFSGIPWQGQGDEGDSWTKRTEVICMRPAKLLEDRFFFLFLILFPTKWALTVIVGFNIVQLFKRQGGALAVCVCMCAHMLACVHAGRYNCSCASYHQPRPRAFWKQNSEGQTCNRAHRMRRKLDSEREEKDEG